MLVGSLASMLSGSGLRICETSGGDGQMVHVGSVQMQGVCLELSSFRFCPFFFFFSFLTVHI